MKPKRQIARDGAGGGAAVRGAMVEKSAGRRGALRMTVAAISLLGGASEPRAGAAGLHTGQAGAARPAEGIRDAV